MKFFGMADVAGSINDDNFTNFSPVDKVIYEEFGTANFVHFQSKQLENNDFRAIISKLKITFNANDIKVGCLFNVNCTNVPKGVKYYMTVEMKKSALMSILPLLQDD